MCASATESEGGVILHYSADVTQGEDLLASKESGTNALVRE